ncbi:hypothetical protein V1264_008131 [Littorina saxatilis]|uniref:Uncharacterized protein n=1 Tax=Littorina saxatilis TaxID=31220 RepID=A0AAN9ATS8_9CAEN
MVWCSVLRRERHCTQPSRPILRGTENYYTSQDNSQRFYPNMTRFAAMMMVLLVVTSLIIDVTARRGMPCIRCRSRCAVTRCACRNSCIGGEGTDCVIDNLTSLSESQQTCVSGCDDEHEDCNTCADVC